MNTLQIYFSFLYPIEIIPSITVEKGKFFNTKSDRRVLKLNWLFLSIETLYRDDKKI
jgi:hypothetical protein